MFPPSANWYCAKVSDWSNKGIFAFGTKNSMPSFDLYGRDGENLTLFRCITVRYKYSQICRKFGRSYKQNISC